MAFFTGQMTLTDGKAIGCIGEDQAKSGAFPVWQYVGRLEMPERPQVAETWNLRTDHGLEAMIRINDVWRSEVPGKYGVMFGSIGIPLSEPSRY